MMEDKILMHKMSFYGYHGALEEERVLGQVFSVSLEISLPLQAAGNSDRLQETLNYARVYRDVQAIMTGPAVNLLETLAERIATAVLAYAKPSSVQVKVTKINPPLPGVMEGVEVCIVRKKV